MSQAPTPYERQKNFVSDATNNPSITVPQIATGLDAEFVAVQDSLNDTISRLAEIQRDDGALKNGVVTAESFATGLALTGDKIADSAISSSKIANGAVVNSKIASGAVQTASIQDGAITTSKIAEGAVITADLADGAVTGAKVATASITADKMTFSPMIKNQEGQFDATGVRVSNVQTPSLPGDATTKQYVDDGINNTLSYGTATPLTRWAATGTGSTSTFSLSGATLANSSAYIVTVDGITQDPASYSISGTNLVFSEAPPVNSAIVVVCIGYQRAIVTPQIGAGSIVSATIADEAVTSSKLASGAVTASKIGASAVTTGAISDGAITDAKISSSVDLSKITTGRPWRTITSIANQRQGGTNQQIRVLTLGDSWATSPDGQLKSIFGDGGAIFTVPNGTTGGAAINSTYDFTRSPNGAFCNIPNSGTATYSAGLPSAIPGRIMKVYYVTDSSSGNMSVQAQKFNRSNSTYSNSGTASVVNANSASIGIGVLNVDLGSKDQYRVVITCTSASVKIIACGIINGVIAFGNVQGGEIGFNLAASGTTIDAAASCPQALWNAILNDYNPNLITIKYDDSLATYQTHLPAYVEKLKIAAPNADIVLLSDHPTNLNPTGNAGGKNNWIKSFANSNGHTFVDANACMPDYATQLALGNWLLGDGYHFAQVGSNYFNSLIYQAISTIDDSNLYLTTQGYTTRRYLTNQYQGVVDQRADRAAEWLVVTGGTQVRIGGAFSTNSGVNWSGSGGGGSLNFFEGTGDFRSGKAVLQDGFGFGYMYGALDNVWFARFANTVPTRPTLYAMLEATAANIDRVAAASTIPFNTTDGSSTAPSRVNVTGTYTSSGPIITITTTAAIAASANTFSPIDITACSDSRIVNRYNAGSVSGSTFQINVTNLYGSGFVASPASGTITFTLNCNDIHQFKNNSTLANGGENLSAIDYNGNFVAKRIGTGIMIREYDGIIDRMGQATLGANGVVVVPNTTVTSRTRIFLTIQTLSGVTVPQAVAVTSRVNGTSFTITSASTADRSIVSYLLVEAFQPNL